MNRRRVGVAWDEGNMAVIQTIRREGEWLVEKGFCLDSSKVPLPDRAGVLKEKWNQEGIALQGIVLTFPQRQSILKTLELPAESENEIRGMLTHQATRLTPLAAEEIIFDYEKWETTPEGKSKVVMVVVRQEDVRSHLAVFNAAGLYPERLILDSFVALPLIKGVTGSEKMSLTIEVRPHLMIIGLFKGNMFCAVRSILLPSIDKPEIWMKTFMEEVQRTLSSFSFPLPSVSFPAQIAGTDAEVAMGCQVGRAVWGDCLLPIKSSERATFLAAQPFMESELSWSALAASRLSSKSLHMNLLSVQERKRGTHVHRQRDRLAFISLALLFCSLAMGTVSMRFHSKKVLLSELTRDCVAQTAGVKDLQDMEQLMNRIKGRMDRHGSFLQIMAQLNRLIPAHVSLRSIDYDNGRALALEGTCFTLSEAVHLVEILQGAALFSNVEMRSSSIQRIRDQDVVEFSLLCHAKV